MSPELSPSLLEKSRVVSFDIFDTLVFRMVARPTDAFYFTGEDQEPLTGVPAGKFHFWRLNCERLLRVVHWFSGQGEISLAAIYQLLVKRLRSGPGLMADLMRLEMAVEDQLLTPDPEMIAFLKAVRSLGKRIVFTSDMYLPLDYVSGLLSKYGISSPGDAIYLSSQIKKRKINGRLFDELLAREGLAPGEMTHVGDDPGADYRAPRKKGIQAILVRRDNCGIPYTMKRPSHFAYRSFLDSISKVTALQGAKEGTDPSLGLLASHVSGPVLFAYVYWLMQKASARSLKRLYFLARDGQILLKIARQIQKTNFPDLELRYTFASRHAWILPSLLDYRNLDQWKCFFKIGKNLTAGRLCRRFYLDPASDPWLASKLARYGLDENGAVTILNLNRAKALIRDEEVAGHIRERASREFETLAGYLGQEGFFDDVPYGVVDVGWRGSMAAALRRVFIRKNVHPKPVDIFYFDLLEKPEYKDIDRFHIFLKELRYGYQEALRSEFEVIMEFICYASHNSTAGFINQGGRIRPRFMPGELAPSHKSDIRDMQQAAVRFCASLSGHPRFAALKKGLMFRACLDALYAFLQHPSEAVVERIRHFPYSPEQVIDGREVHNVFCSPFKLSDFVDLLRHRHVMRKNDVWIQGSLTLTRNPVSRAVFWIFYRIISFKIFRRVEQNIRDRMKF